ncbi:glutamyl-tRNA(Gln) amidotransferase, C subunit [Thermocrinis albus DSM 14484]|uniref:Aspartyl/glutamyl-tRNA(Asn/Gln) amidotransferase subunit C n=1 Tax=Thermocrinis albus (strain DSM 14484 / JCM 11386 / HI 11/12) TaxID=638303 RepID=D3SL91_THEAH|nr:Asp-tRNA(Asn)/Glu-tRNA(Gln) amidotransferase subunit GatC [Thermocrinis albus]ADC89521.1 glutamyl-tRNA(Gln) amidotransferase, C subunit [Thermocrinis albus DSM 14484]
MDRDIVDRVASLAKLSLKEEERELLGKQLLDIINFVRQLEEVDTSHVDQYLLTENSTPLREDEPRRSFSQEKALMNAPQRENGFFVVPQILE